MANDSTKLIEKWFVEQSGDGEFVQNARAVPYYVIGGAAGGGDGKVMFTTKPTIVSSAIDKAKESRRFEMIGRYGLPNKSDLKWIRELVGSRVLLFVGDMDPVDLMVFAWLRARLAPIRMIHLGVNDSFLRVLQIKASKALFIPLSRTEKKSYSTLKRVFPDFQEAIGEKCATGLRDGHKIELEAVVSAKGSAASILHAAIDATE